LYFVNVWLGIVITNSPSAGLYVAVVGVNDFTPSFIIPVTKPNDELIWFTSIIDADIDDDVYCTVLVTLIFPSVFVVSVGEFNLIFWTIALANAFA
jgi:hypothetical protein